MLTKKAEFIVSQIENFSGRCVENRAMLLRYVVESLSENKLVTFYNWECPPRRINYRGDKFYVDYDIDLKKIFNGEKIDEYTEFPRVVEKGTEEIEALSFIKSLGFASRFVKFIADTNAYYLTPESLGITGSDIVRSKFEEFSDLINNELKRYPVGGQVVLFTKTIEPFLNIYESIFATSIEMLRRRPGYLVSTRTFKDQLRRTREHIGIKDRLWAEELSERTIASYAAEGVVFELISATKKYSNCVWLNNHEIDERTVEITNCFRRKLGIEKLPMIFLGK